MTYTFTNTEASAYVARMTVTPSDLRCSIIDTYIGALKSAGVWSKLDALYIQAAADVQSAKLNAVQNAYNITLNGATTFTVDKGIKGTTLTGGGYGDTGFNPSTAVGAKYLQNDCNRFGWSLESLEQDAPIYGTLSSVESYCYPAFGDGSSYIRLQVGGSYIAASTDASGFWATSRVASTGFSTYKNGVLKALTATASTALATSNFISMRTNASDSFTNNVPVWGFGGGLTGTEETALYNATKTYLQNIGAVTIGGNAAITDANDTLAGSGKAIQWTPANLATAPVEWFKADSGVTLSGSNVATLAQKGSHTGGLSVPAAFTGPTQGTLNNKKTLAFSAAANTGLNTFNTRNFASGALTFFVVAKRTAGRTSTYDILVNTDAPWDSGHGFANQYDTGSAGVVSMYGGNGYGGGSPYGQVADPAGPAQDGLWHVIESHANASAIVMAFDANIQSLYASAAGASPTLTGYALDVGFNTDGNWLGGEIAEIIILNYEPTAIELAQIQGYLAWEWGAAGSSITDLVAKMPATHLFKGSAPTLGRTGAANIADSNDTLAGAGFILSGVHGSASITDANDTLMGSGKVAVQGTAGVTDANDTLTGGGNVAVKGTAGITDANDTLSGSGTLGAGTIHGDASITDANDTLAGAGKVTIQGNAPITDANDTLSGAGVSPIKGTAPVTDANDTLSGAGAVAIKGSAAVTDANDTLSGSGNVLHSVTGDFSGLDTDTLVAVGQVLPSGTEGVFQPGAFQDGTFDILEEVSFTLQEAKDTLSFTTEAGKLVSFALVGTKDTASFTTGITSDVTFNIQELKDTAHFNVPIQANLSFAITATKDTLAFNARTGTLINFAIVATKDTFSGGVTVFDGRFATFALQEPKDTLSAAILSTWNVALAVTDRPDTIHFTTRTGILIDFSLQERVDSIHFVAEAKAELTFALQERKDKIFFRTFSTYWTEGDSDYIPIPPENRSVIVRPANDNLGIQEQSFARTGHVQSENRVIEIAQNHALREDEL